MNVPGTLFAARSIIEDKISSIQRVVELTDPYAEVSMTFEAHAKKYETEVSLLTDNAPQHTFIRRKTADTLIHALGTVVSLSASPKKARDKI